MKKFFKHQRTCLRLESAMETDWRLKKIKDFAKTQIMKLLKSLAISWIICLLISIFLVLTLIPLFWRNNKVILATFENHLDLLLRECAERREKNFGCSQNFDKSAYCPTKKHRLRHNVKFLCYIFMLIF